MSAIAWSKVHSPHAADQEGLSIALGITDAAALYSIIENISIRAMGAISAEIVTDEAGQALTPLGLGSTGRTEAKSLTEELAMKEAMSNPAAGKIIKEGLKDARWPGWSKMQYIHSGLDGSKTVIHYNGKWVNGILEAVDDFKFK
jgi:hypothetical protein